MLGILTYGGYLFTFGGKRFLRLWVRHSYVWRLVFLRLGARDSYGWGLVFLRLGVRDSYVYGLVFLRLGVSVLSFGN